MKERRLKKQNITKGRNLGDLQDKGEKMFIDRGLVQQDLDRGLTGKKST